MDGVATGQSRHITSLWNESINARTIDDATWQFAQDRLLEQWSPEQISGHAAISPETVYQRVYANKRAGGLLWKNLRSQKLRKKRYGKVERRGTIPNRVSIDDRAAIVETRSRLGDWEADTVIGKNHRQAIVSIVERKTGFTLIQKVERKTALAVSQAMIGLLKPPEVLTSGRYLNRNMGRQISNRHQNKTPCKPPPRQCSILAREFVS